MTERQRKILQGLRHGPLDHYQLAADIAEAPFTVRADLKALKRDRIVTDRITNEAHTWELTAAGLRQAYEADQLAIGGA